jgi:hypothetical protein
MHGTYVTTDIGVPLKAQSDLSRHDRLRRKSAYFLAENVSVEVKRSSEWVYDIWIVKL